MIRRGRLASGQRCVGLLASRVASARLARALSTASAAMRPAQPPTLGKLPPQPTPQTLPGLLYAADAIRLRERLAAGRELRATITWREFVELCGDLNISPARALSLAADLQLTGSILHTDGAVCLRPGELISHMLSSNAISVLAEADELGASTRSTMVDLDSKARVATTRTAALVGFGLAVQGAVLFRLTYWELGWDTVEPLAFFVGQGTTICWFLFFVGSNKEAAYMSLDSVLFQRIRARLYRRAGLEPAAKPRP
ncbi:hypothetical protein T492DRAFT_979507 [Pavlovales sp. CCMP2436]|nr:hypothetical protein T492DRAFT_979507 [Pavlovales sp. CCMP2436]|mmetsp:Transcript_25209/g.59333  ORF Transcript_25209/g.59333 Transcript_25209/m.59333 type:complete len:256 (+) Transcript_25209:151-918(+)